MKMTILKGDTFQRIREIPDSTIDLCITSPPYFNLRDYSLPPVDISNSIINCDHEFEEFTMKQSGGTDKSTVSEKLRSAVGFETKQGVCKKCGDYRGNYGAEPTLEMYLDHSLMWIKEVYRTLRPTGSFVINIGDTFYGSGIKSRKTDCKTSIIGGVQNLGGSDVQIQRGKAQKELSGKGIYKPRNLIAVSHFLYCKILQETDFICRGSHVWAKPNSPSSIRSRLKHNHEHLYWFVKDADNYYFDKTPWLKPITDLSEKRYKYDRLPIEDKQGVGLVEHIAGADYQKTTIESSWRIVPVGGQQDGFEIHKVKRARHFFIQTRRDCIRRLQEANTLKEEKDRLPIDAIKKQAIIDAKKLTAEKFPDEVEFMFSSHVAPYPVALIEPYIKSLCPPDGVVFDPWGGSGTTSRVAMENHRSSIMCELSDKVIKYAQHRLNWGHGLDVEYEVK